MSLESGKVRKKNRFLRALIVVLIVIAGMFMIRFGLIFALGTPSPLVLVSSNSMFPTLKTGDEVIIQGVSFDSLKEGDIIVFERPTMNIVHRIYKIIQSDGEKVLMTKGDNNPGPDPWVVKKSEYVGKLVITIPYIGYFTGFLSPPMNYIIIIFLIALIFITELIGVDRAKSNKKNNINCLHTAL